MKKIENLNIKIFADGAEKTKMLELNSSPLIKGLTTNPTLMKKAGIVNYSDFCTDILNYVKINLFLLKYFLMISMKWKDKL